MNNDLQAQRERRAESESAASAGERSPARQRRAEDQAEQAREKLSARRGKQSGAAGWAQTAPRSGAWTVPTTP